MPKTPKTSPVANAPTKAPPSVPPSAPPEQPTTTPMDTALQAWGPLGEYMVDAAQRTILFWDVLRRRSNQYYEQKAKAAPNVLTFGAELVLDGSTFERPVNYGLVRVLPPEGVAIDPKKRPFVVVDPRAGQDPGIGGFRSDSELGVAMRAGHPCYFVGFTPEPIPGQTIEDIVHAEARFLEKVIELHPQAEGKPCVIGNCQAGWSVMMVAATRPELFGPIIIPGSPLSYWAGVEGKAPMRYTGGLAGGSWATALMGDLGAGKFDGAYLVGNFDNLHPANTLWTKNYNVWSKVDTEAQRFLDFEKWWGGYITLSAEEMQWIVDQLFVGNRLATAEIITSDGVRIDLRDIRSPIVCFCSKGDDITPPPQALGWIVDLYGKDEDILAAGQTIIYAIHDHIGHLGIFVSGSVAKKEHEEFATNIDLIDVLPPGLYEAVITPKTPEMANPDLVEGDWLVRFERRTLDDVRAIVQPDPENERRFATVRRVSEINLGLYRTLLQPFIKALPNAQTVELLHQLNPTVLPFELFSDQNPVMQQIAQLADQVREQRRPATPDNPFVTMQTMVSEGIIAALDTYQDLRDKTMEEIFMAIYSSPVLQALVGIRASDEPPRRRPGVEPEQIAFVQKRISEIKARIAVGGPAEAVIRSLVYIGLARAAVDERAFNELRQIRAEHGKLSLAEFKQVLREQYFGLLLDRNEALAAIPRMLGDDPRLRQDVLAVIRKVASAPGEVTDQRAERLAEIEALINGAPTT